MSEKDFFQFLQSDKRTAKGLDQMILAKAKAGLIRDQFFAILNVVGIHAVAGDATLAICPQFGWDPFQTSSHLPHLFMNYGMWACGLLCGVIFMGLGAFLKIFVLKKRTLAIFEKKEVIKELGEPVGIQRYKGLGEMNPKQLWETTMDPEVRSLKQVAIEDAVEADRIFNTLMGDDVMPRREFIEKHAGEVEELDI